MRVAYGTSQCVNTLYAGAFAVTSHNARAYELARLSDATQFNFTRSVELSYNDKWFSVPPGVPHGQTPKLGVLHPSLIRKAAAAHAAAQARALK